MFRFSYPPRGCTWKELVILDTPAVLPREQWYVRGHSWFVVRLPRVKKERFERDEEGEQNLSIGGPE